MCWECTGAQRDDWGPGGVSRQGGPVGWDVESLNEKGEVLGSWQITSERRPKGRGEKSHPSGGGGNQKTRVTMV